MNTAVTGDHKFIARLIAEAFGASKPPIARHMDDAGKSSVWVLEAKDSPCMGVSSFATIGLSDSPLYRDGAEFPSRVELVGACLSTVPGFSEVLSTAAFCVINSRWFCAPGMIFPNVVELVGLSTHLTDLYFSHPFCWNGPSVAEVSGRRVAWLQAIPISKEETKLAVRSGPQELESMLQEAGADLFDLRRKSVC